VHAVRTDGDGDVETIVHVELRAARRGGLAQPLGERQQRPSRQVLFPELDRRQTGIQRAGDDVHQIAIAGGAAIGHQDQRRDQRMSPSSGLDAVA
jgi:hypothetical protein